MTTAKMALKSGDSEISQELSTDRLVMATSAPNGIKKMRELILELAVRGKLVPQDPKDEPASELLKRIKSEKEKLINAGQVKKGDQLLEIFNSDKPFELPKGWEWTRLQNISKNIHYGYTASANPISKDILFLRITDIQDNRVDWASVPGCDIDNKNFLSYALSNGDILIARTGGTIGKSYLVENITQKAVFASYLIRVERLNSTYPNYTKVYLGSKLYWDQLFSKSMGTGQPNVNGTALKSLIFPLPPLREQKSIVAKVDELMVLCDQMEAREADAEAAHETLVKALLGSLTQSQTAEDFQGNWQRIAKNFNVLFTTEASLESLKQTFLQLAVMGKLVPQDPKDEPATELLKRIKAEKEKLVKAGKIKQDKPLPEIADSEKPYDLPKGWEWERLGSFVYVEMGQSPPSEYYNQNREGLPFFQGKADFGKKFPTARYWCIAPNKLAYGGDVLLSVRAPVGPTNIATNKCCIGRGLAALRPLSGSSTDYLINTIRAFQKNLESLGTGTTFIAISRKDIDNFTIPIAPFAEQKRIVAKVDELMALCDRLEERLAKFRSLHEQLATALVEKAVAG